MGKSSAVVASSAPVSTGGVAASVPVRVRVGTSARPTRAGRRARRVAGPARRPVCPVPTGPGRAASGLSRHPVRPPVRSGAPYPPARVAGRVGVARPVGLRPAVARPMVLGARSAGSRWSAVRQFLAVALVAAVAVGGLGLLADGARAARVPSSVGVVEVHSGESLWQVARRVAPSADPDAVVTRMVELNHLGSPSVPADARVVSPIG